MGARNNRAGPFVGRSVKVVRDRVGRSVGRFTQWVTGRCAFAFRDNALIESEPCSAFENRTNKNFLSFSFFQYLIVYNVYNIRRREMYEYREREREERKVRGWMPRLFYRIIRCNDPRMDLDRDDATYSRLFREPERFLVSRDYAFHQPVLRRSRNGERNGTDYVV